AHAHVKRFDVEPAETEWILTKVGLEVEAHECPVKCGIEAHENRSPASSNRTDPVTKCGHCLLRLAARAREGTPAASHDLHSLGLTVAVDRLKLSVERLAGFPQDACTEGEHAVRCWNGTCGLNINRNIHLAHLLSPRATTAVTVPSSQWAAD